MISRTTRKALATFIGSASSIALMIMILFQSVAASTATDGSTPLALTPGAPAGSYPLSDLDHLNVYSGNINFGLPLLGIGGRGGASYTMTRVIEQHWRVNHTILSDGRELNVPVYNPWTPIDPGYGPGALYGRQVSENSCSQGYPSAVSLTRLTFVTPDGTEHELVDKLTGGEVRTSFCWAGLGFARGTVFVSTHGEAMTFVSDSTIYDFQFGASSFYPTGYLLLSDGTRFRIVNGRVEWLRDRNGNQVTITYPTSTRMIATDPLGRQVIVDKNFSDVAPYGLCDKITFNGIGGVQRFIRVSKTNLGSALRSGYSLQTPAALFPQLDGSSSTNHDPQVVSAVWLPDGIKSYQFRYNSYGELARVELPTGGAFEYDYAAGLVSGYPSGVFFTLVFSSTEIYRRVTERRIYKEGGVLEHKTTISRTDSQYSNDTMVTVDKLNSGGALLTRSKHYFYGNPAQSFDVDPWGYPRWKHGHEYKTEDFDTNGTTILRRVEHTWQQPVAGSTWPLSQPETSDSVKANNPQVTETLITLEPATANQVSKQVFAYDQYINKTDVWEYGFGSGAPPVYATRRKQSSFLTINPINSLDYASPNPTATSFHLRTLLQHHRVYSVNPSNGQETQVSHTELVYDETALNPWYGTVTQWTNPGTARGNATKIKNWVNPGNTWLESRAQFDQVGNVSKSWDQKNNQTEIAYSATYQFAYPTQTTSPIPDPTGQYGSTTALVATRTYDLSTGLVTSTTDSNNQTTNILYNDALDRPTQVTRAVGTAIQTQSTFSYDDSLRVITTTSDLHSTNDNVLKSETVYDGLGRTVETRQFEGGSNYIAVRTQYDALGRPFKTSNPFRPSETPVWTTQVFDALGRVTSVTTPDNAVVNTSYSGNSVTVTDQAGKARKSVTDALGRLIEVYEDPNGVNYQTAYDYDVLDDLVKVTQGSQQRFFMYDSVRRLIRARNPEQSTFGSLTLADPITGNSAWSIGYQYDANSNLTEKTDARGVVSTYVYDALNRNTTINHSDTAVNPDVSRFYDGADKGIGRLWKSYAGGTELVGSNVEKTIIDSYDALGRPLVQRQFFKLNNVWSERTYQTSRAFNRAGGVTSQTYPSGHSVTYNYDVAGRLADKDVSHLAFTGNLGDGVLRTYAAGITYSQWGSLSREQFGTNTAVYNKVHYNIRGQLCDVRASNSGDEWGGELGALVNYFSTTWAHCGSGTDNNGNVLMNQTIINSYYMEDRYSYDALNRLTAVNEWQNGSTHTGSQQYDYDRWGNRTIKPASWGIGINTKQFTVDTATNQLGVPTGQSGTLTYDNAGNLITDTYTGAGLREYDAENRMTRAWGGNNQSQYYAYNADGQRVRRKVDAQETWQIYGFGGELLAEYAANGPHTNPQKEYGYRNGQLLVTAAADTVWFDDALPAGASAFGDGEGWNWVGSSPSPFTGSLAHQSNLVAGLHQHYFLWATATLSVSAGEKLFAYVYLDPSNLPSQIMLQWNDGSWEHRAYWGANNLPWGVDGTNSRRYMGPLPTAGTWVRLEVPASQVGLEGSTLNGMAFSMWGGRATWDAAGKAAGGSSSLKWSITDHLGTPRMIIDQTGTLANIKRHDYLPFGEELFAPAGGRSVSMGYASGDGVRQQFTSKERDLETALDYFGARYYASSQGRFTSVDPANYQAVLNPTDPQSWNAYSYVNNSPLHRVDPDGRGFFDRLKNLLRGRGFRTDAEVQEAARQREARIQAEEAQRRAELAQLAATNPTNLLYVQQADNSYVSYDVNTLTREQVWEFSNRQRAGNVTTMSTEDYDRATPFMGMLPFAGGMPIYRGGPTIEVKDIDVRIKDGLVQPTRGPSLNMDPAQVEKFGGAYRVASIPDELQIIQRGANASHYEIVPKNPMPFERFVQLLKEVKLVPK